ncbi:unnamed protein product [Notodromas monacha]|uniref:pyridoxal 5'-phosphate synthase n=1 Tax=Notodromas monacha TaxID=399045 RepID=A0A7R9BRP6_9CRUS|nr:unnamed protein product [Notodromas monacha]CAG0919382.1 unnamed protein product [Notodromas monacha]
MTEEVKEDLGAMRKPYFTPETLFLEDELVKDPIQQFKIWFDEAKAHSGIREANACCLATCGANGYPSARIVLLKGFSNEGFTFFTNYNSRKARELADNNKAAMTFYWEPLVKQIRIEGRVEKIPEQDSEEYFLSRPLVSKIGAWASPQSQPVPDRAYLDTRVKEFETKFGDQVPKPEHWGGYVLRAERVEFWRGQSSRVHDRIRFRKPEKDEKVDGVLVHPGLHDWVYERLGP